MRRSIKPGAISSSLFSFFLSLDDDELGLLDHDSRLETFLLKYSNELLLSFYFNFRLRGGGDVDRETWRKGDVEIRVCLPEKRWRIRRKIFASWNAYPPVFKCEQTRILSGIASFPFYSRRVSPFSFIRYHFLSTSAWIMYVELLYSLELFDCFLIVCNGE